MRPPWKYLARLVSRQRSSELPEKSTAPDSVRKLVEIGQRPAAAIPFSPPEPTPGTEQIDERSPENVVAVPAGNKIDVETLGLPPEFTDAPKANGSLEAEQSNFDPLEQWPAVETAASLPKIPRTRLKTAKKSRVNSTVEIRVTTADAPFPATSSPTGSFFDKATSLDEEIKQLKDQLAQKVRMQNAQLRQMLERFERS